MRIGFHPGVRVYVPPAPPPATAGARRLPSRRRIGRRRSAQCDPCTVEVGPDLDGDRDGAGSGWRPVDVPLDGAAARWRTRRERQTVWTAPQQEGTVPVTVTVSDGKGGTASDMANIQVHRGRRSS